MEQLAFLGEHPWSLTSGSLAHCSWLQWPRIYKAFRRKDVAWSAISKSKLDAVLLVKIVAWPKKRASTIATILWWAHFLFSTCEPSETSIAISSNHQLDTDSSRYLSLSIFVQHNTPRTYTHQSKISCDSAWVSSGYPQPGWEDIGYNNNNYRLGTPQKQKDGDFWAEKLTEKKKYKYMHLQ